MHQPDLCDGCLEPIESSDPWTGQDDYPSADEECDEDEFEDVDDSQPQRHFHRHDDYRCIFAWVMRQIAEVNE